MAHLFGVVANVFGAGVTSVAAKALANSSNTAASINELPNDKSSYTTYYIVVVTCLVLFCRTKVTLWLNGIVFLIASNEKKGMSKYRDTADLVPTDKSQENLDSKVIIFVRHGESDWNFIFNKDKLKLLPRLILGFFRELLMLTSSTNSVFIDSDLSPEGVAQAKHLQNLLHTPGIPHADDADAENVRNMKRVLRGDAGKSVIVTSNLRRAVTTGVLAFYPRLQRKKEKLIILSSLQEMSKNVDTKSLAAKGELPDTSRLAEELDDPHFKPADCLNAKQANGNKELFSKAVDRMEEFCGWCFDQKEPFIIVGAGHSLWFKNFFKTFMPKKAEHIAKEKKLANCGVVAFKLEKGTIKHSNGKVSYRVDVDSMTEIYGGFEKSKFSGKVPNGSGLVRTKTKLCEEDLPAAKPPKIAAPREQIVDDGSWGMWCASPRPKRDVH